MRQVWPMVDATNHQRCPVLGDNQSDTSVPKAMFGARTAVAVSPPRVAGPRPRTRAAWDREDLEHVPPELNRQDSHGVLDRRFYRH